jgi:hypothetical protein
VPYGGNDWLALTQEPILEPELPICDALAPSCFGRNPAVRRLFPDYRAVEEAYFKETRIFPIM